MFDIMSFLNGGTTTPQQVQQTAMPTQDTQGKGITQQWNDYLADPNVRAAMLSAGLAMMRPTWGGTGQAIVSGIGAGAETYAEREQMEAQNAQRQQAQNLAAEERSNRRKDKEMDRAQALEIAEMNNATRRQVAAARVGATGGKNTQLGYYNALLKQNTLPGGGLKDGLTNEELFEQAADMAARDRAAALGGTANLASRDAQAGPKKVSGPQSTGRNDAASRPSSAAPANGPIRKFFLDTATNQRVEHELRNGQWVKIGK